mgnify:FL=1
MINKINYVAIAGDSGGHIFPAIRYINELSQIKNPKNILFITNNAGSEYCDQINSKNVNLCIINSRNKFLFILNITKYLIPLFIRNRKLILVGFGGFITTPVLYISKFFNIINSNKIFIHEQNYVLGLANKINYFIADKVFTSFPSRKINKKEIYVGNFFNSINKYTEELNHNYINILLLGGSGGSLELNNILLSKLKNLDKELLNKVKLSVQIPSNYFKKYQENYLKIIKNINFFKFNNNLDYTNYDLIISRSGSGSLNDILYCTDSVYFVPHLNSRDGHQSFNLDFYRKHSNFLEKLEILDLKKKTNLFYINSLINPFSMNKIICYLTK